MQVRMTPRSVMMGNKSCKLHVRYGNDRQVLEFEPDTPLSAVKEKIGERFQVPPEEQKLLCNGKMILVEEDKTLKQARIPNNSKIIVMKASSDVDAEDEADDGQPSGHAAASVPGDQGHDPQHPNGQPGQQTPGAAAWSPNTSRTSCGNEHADNGERPGAEKLLQNIEDEGSEVEKTVLHVRDELDRIRGNAHETPDDRCRVMKRLKFECGKCGELLMKLFEKLDTMQFLEHEVEFKSKRKAVATYLNKILDKSDATVQEISDEIDTSQNA